MHHRDTELARRFAHHEIQRAPARSWKMAQPGTWNLGYFVTWSPGSITLSGDLGELTLTHYHALADLWSGIFWLARGDFDYLIEKSNQEKVYDPEATYRTFVTLANEQAREAAASLRIRRTDLAGEMAFDRVANEIADDAPEPAPTGEDLRVARAKIRDDDPEVRYEVWEALADALLCDRADVHTIRGRQRLKREIARRVETQEAAIDLALEAGIDDYHGSRTYTDWQRTQIAALQTWSQTMIAREPAWHRAWRALASVRDRLRHLAREARRGRLHLRPRRFVRTLGTRQAHYLLVTRGDGEPTYVEVHRVAPGLWHEQGARVPAERARAGEFAPA